MNIAQPKHDFAAVVQRLWIGLNDGSIILRSAQVDGAETFWATRSLIEKLSKRNAKIRYAASVSLVSIGVPAISQLMIALGSPDSRVANSAADILSVIGGPAIDSLLEALTFEDATVRKYAARGLGYAWDKQRFVRRQDAEKISNSLSIALSDISADVRAEAARALAKMRPTTTSWVSPYSRPGVRSEDHIFSPNLRLRAINVLLVASVSALLCGISAGIFAPVLSIVLLTWGTSSTRVEIEAWMVFAIVAPICFAVVGFILGGISAHIWNTFAEPKYIYRRAVEEPQAHEHVRPVRNRAG